MFYYHFGDIPALNEARLDTTTTTQLQESHRSGGTASGPRDAFIQHGRADICSVALCAEDCRCSQLTRPCSRPALSVNSIGVSIAGKATRTDGGFLLITWHTKYMVKLGQGSCCGGQV